MIPDDVLLEVRAAKEAYAAEHNFDVMAMIEDLRRRSVAAGRTVIKMPPRKPIDMSVALPPVQKMIDDTVIESTAS